MDLKNQIIQEYLTQGCGFRQLAAKYGISRTTICKWVAIHQGIHNLPATEKQHKYSNSSMNSSSKKITSTEQQTEALQQVLHFTRQDTYKQLSLPICRTKRLLSGFLKLTLRKD